MFEITGTDFGTGALVTFGGYPATITYYFGSTKIVGSDTAASGWDG